MCSMFLLPLCSKLTELHTQGLTACGGLVASVSTTIFCQGNDFWQSLNPKASNKTSQRNLLLCLFWGLHEGHLAYSGNPPSRIRTRLQHADTQLGPRTLRWHFPVLCHSQGWDTRPPNKTSQVQAASCDKQENHRTTALKITKNILKVSRSF